MSERLTDAEIDAIAARADAATANVGDAPLAALLRHGRKQPGPWDEYDEPLYDDGDATFLAQARRVIISLVAEVRRLRGAEARVRARHYPYGGSGYEMWCRSGCGSWPCPTIAALDGAES